MNKRYSIITKDLERCVECGRYDVELHEVFFGTANRKLSIEDGLVIPLCKALHHNGNLIGIHKDKDLNEKWKKKAQKRWQEFYGRDEEAFIKRYGKSCLWGGNMIVFTLIIGFIAYLLLQVEKHEDIMKLFKDEK